MITVVYYVISTGKERCVCRYSDERISPRFRGDGDMLMDAGLEDN